MTKAQIIEKTLDEIGRARLELGEEEVVIAELGRRLPDGADIKTCGDIKNLGVECDDCHTVYPHYDMSLIDLPVGGKAWVCDSVKWAIFPEGLKKLEEWSRISPEGKLLRHIFGAEEE